MILSGLLRILASVIDLLIIYFPSVLILQVIFGMNFRMADLTAQILYFLVVIIIGNYSNGKSIGKYFAKLRVLYLHENNDIVYVGLRELPKLLYFLPHVGFLFLGVSILIYFIKGTTLHDLIGGSKVVSEREFERMIHSV